MSDERGDEYFATKEAAEHYILEQNLLDKGYSDVYVRTIKVNE